MITGAELWTYLAGCAPGDAGAAAALRLGGRQRKTDVV